jgi:hypothetical protein
LGSFLNTPLLVLFLYGVLRSVFCDALIEYHCLFITIFSPIINVDSMLGWIHGCILMQHQNVPASACICVFTTLQNLHHTVRTIYGDSKSGYGGTLWEVPYSGVGQGDGAGPATWAVVSTPVLKMMKDEGFGFMYKTSIEGKQLYFVGYSFVHVGAGWSGPHGVHMGGRVAFGNT